MQRVVHRSGLFSRLPIALLCLALVLFAHVLIRQNLPDRYTRDWPWRLELLDVQSAVAAVLATGGVALARAQYARTVRPALGYIGRVQRGHAPGDQLAWTCHLINSSQDVAVTVDMSYRVTYTPAAHARGIVDWSEWGTRDAAVASIEASGLVHRTDFALNSMGAGWPLAGQQLPFLGWFTEKAMRDVDHVYVRVRVLDRVGDTYERVIDLLRAADRAPAHPDPPLV
ncbi:MULTISPECIES: hypothetical protein [unclassified Streptomyces]|uniref:hypothetical protein n=1 Tax=unclassified Streptomyces TaxID=2593676 RepID=UPI0019272DFF|nr:hypothetical protein [Streptomyces sp. MD20-1-1]WTC20977.1 hypothetical protein OH709_19035 [Streptomyces cellulosae]